MVLVSEARTRAHWLSSALPNARAPGATTGGLPLSAVESPMASVQPSQWLSRSESDWLDSPTPTSVRRASKRISAGPLEAAVRCEACTIPSEAKKAAVYTQTGG